MKSIIKSRFVTVKCAKCKNEQIIFTNPSTKVKCLVCGAILAKPKGGKANIVAKIIKVLD